MNDFITIRTFNHAHDAALVQSILIEHGIDAILKDEIISSVNPGYSTASGGVKLQVLQSQLNTAVEVLLQAGYLKPEDLKPDKGMAVMQKIIQFFLGFSGKKIKFIIV